MPVEIATEITIRASRCECDGEMYPADDRGGRGTGLYTVECGGCGGIGGVNAETMIVYGAVDRLEIDGK